MRGGWDLLGIILALGAFDVTLIRWILAPTWPCPRCEQPVARGRPACPACRSELAWPA